MPALNLPNLNFNIDSGTDKQTLEQIVDSLSKYRKELNFLLMNLDTDNMPAVTGLIEDAFGNMSSISQTVDAINLTVSNAVGDISNLQIQADSIISTVGNNTGDISTVIQTANGIQTQVNNNTGDISTVIQTANGLASTVSTQGGWITDQGTIIGNHTSQITQLGNEISSVVSFTDVTGNQIASLINQTATTIDINASKLNLQGITTIYDDYDTSSFARFDDGYFYLNVGGSKLFSVEKNVLGYALINTTAGSGGTPVYFPNKVIFAGEVVGLPSTTAKFA